MTLLPPRDRYRDRLTTIIAVILVVTAMHASYTVSMPIAFAGIVVAALWPLKRWLDRCLPSWLSYSLAVLVFIAVVAGFAGAVYIAIGQLLGVVREQWPAIERGYGAVSGLAGRWGIPLNGSADMKRLLGFAETFAASVYGLATFVGFIGLLVILGLPEAARLGGKVRHDMDGDARQETIAIANKVSEQVRRYLGVTFATSVLTGVASAAWALVTGLDLALVWGLLNFLLNFIPVIGNIIGIIPPSLYAVVQFHGYGMPLVIFAGFAALQIAISNFVYPILQGRQLSLSPVAIIIAMTFWGWVWGIAGALIAVPLTAATVVVCEHFDRSRWIAKLVSN